MNRELLKSEERKIAAIESMINDTSGKFFGATNIKKDGTVRKYGQVRIEVGKFVKGTGKSLDREKNPTLRTLWENTGKSEPTYKAFDLLTCTELRIAGVVYQFKSLPKETLEAMRKAGESTEGFEELN